MIFYVKKKILMKDGERTARKGSAWVGFKTFLEVFVIVIIGKIERFWYPRERTCYLYFYLVFQSGGYAILKRLRK